jgi:glucosamine 6-phosphate synthetase-like amidotransferase/phosphosugar isomerase protein
MCGIVGYFGSTGNNLTRPLTAMSAIVYRAPDSSGIGFFGDDAESIRIVKALGPVSSCSKRRGTRILLANS